VTKRSATSATGYSAADLQVLEGLDAVRKRPGMYIGSTDTRGLTHLVYEIVDNAVDEAVAGHCDRIEVKLCTDGSVEVTDNGRGIPVDVNPQTKLTGVELVFTKLHAGGKFGGSGYKVSGGLHGVGASVVNALSARLEVEVHRDKRRYTMLFRQGVAGTETKGRFRPGAVLVDAGRVPAKDTGTRVRFWPDRDIFTADAAIDVDALTVRMRTTAYLVAGLTIELIDETQPERSAQFSSTAGIIDLLGTMHTTTVLHKPLRLNGTGRFTETVPVLDGETLVSKDVEREVEVDIAMCWVDGFDGQIASYVNIVSTSKGGTHVTGFERAVVRVVQDWCKGKTRANEDGPEKQDVLEGLYAVVSVAFPEPQYEGQTKEILGTAAVAKVVADVLAQQLRAVTDQRGGKALQKTVTDKVVAAMRTRRALRAQRDVIRRKNALESSHLPAKLVDCRAHGETGTELLIVEGDSAMGTAKSARDSRTQALLPIRGKILNTLRASEQKMLDNAECASIITALGAGSGRGFDLDQVRYEKLIILADADIDGAHIRTLLLCLVWRYMRPLLEAGRVYAAVPPLHRIAVSGGEVRYTYSDAELAAANTELAAAGRTIREVQRYKGLGEMDSDQLFETTLDPERRILRRLTLQDAAHAERVFELLMGNEVGPRRDFIVEASGDFDLASLDV
jgi:DNA gyrase subunit B